ncbi:MAG: hypothetical protein ACK5F7_21580, partial [Planctomycetaceae bacterium]
MSLSNHSSGCYGLVWWAGVGLLLLGPATWGAPARGDDWPQFLGPNRTGISQETGLISAWPAEG